MAITGTKPAMSDEKKAELIASSKTGTELNLNLIKIGSLTFEGRVYPSKELVAIVTVLAWKYEHWSGVINDPSGVVDEDRFESGTPEFSIPEEYYHNPEFDKHFVMEDDIARSALFPINMLPPILGLRNRMSELLGLIGTTNPIEPRTASST